MNRQLRGLNIDNQIISNEKLNLHSHPIQSVEDPTNAQDAATKNYVDTAAQPLDADLTAIGALAKTDGNIIVGDGATWVAESGDTIIPSGVILMWSGSVATIPNGWVICNGENGTPNLTGRFVVHADADGGGIYNPGNTGGENTHTLTIDEMPAHVHAIAVGEDPNEPGPYIAGCPSTSTTVNSNSTGNDGAHENRPPYYALCYIMKT